MKNLFILFLAVIVISPDAIGQLNGKEFFKNKNKFKLFHFDIDSINILEQHSNLFENEKFFYIQKITPDKNFSYNMPFITPDSSIDYKILKIEPEQKPLYCFNPEGFDFKKFHKGFEYNFPPGFNKKKQNDLKK